MLTKSFQTACLWIGLGLSLLTACSPSSGIDVSEGDSSPAIILETPPAGHLPAGVEPRAYRLDLITDPSQNTFSGQVEIDIQLRTPHARIWLHSLDQNVLSAEAVLADGTRLEGVFSTGYAEGGVSRIDFDTPVPAGRSTLVIAYEAAYNFGLAGLYKATQNDRPYLASQMEPIDARRMVPCFDEPRFKTPWTLTVTAPAGNQVITNAPLKAQSNVDNGMIRHQFATTRRIQSYLLALAVGPYDLRHGDVLAGNAIRAKSVPFRGYAPAGKGARLATAMDVTEDMLRWQEEYFDYPYPYAKLDLIAVPDFAYGAMENAGAIIYRESALLMDDRTSLAARRAILTTHAHELAHQWFGNLVTPRWWDDIWLNEAFATWMSYKTLDAVFPGTGFDLAPQRAAIGVMDADSLQNARQIRNPITRNADILDAFDGITYRKGGGVLSMFETYLGETDFRDSMRAHMRRFEDGVADVNDFMASLAEGSGNLTLIDSFKSFIFQPGVPMLNVTVSCPGPEAGRITITQTRFTPVGSKIDPKAQSWLLPLTLRFQDRNGTHSLRKLMRDSVLDVPITTGCPDWVMPNAGGTGYWRFSLDAPAWQSLIGNYQALTAGEQLSFADSVGAAFSADAIRADIWLQALAVNANGEWSAAARPLDTLITYYHLMDDAMGRAALRDFISEIYMPRYTQLKTAVNRDRLSEGNALLATRLHSTLLEIGALAEPREDLIEKARAFIGMDGIPDPDALSPEELSIALQLAVKDGDSAFFSAALDFAEAHTHQRERRLILNKLSQFGQPDDVLVLMDRVLTDDFRGQEAWGVYMAALDNHSAQETTWQHFMTRFDAMIARTPEIRKPQTGRVVGSFCTPDKITQAVDFLKGKAALMPGYERGLAQAEEKANLCSAFTERRVPELKTALKNRPGAFATDL